MSVRIDVVDRRASTVVLEHGRWRLLGEAGQSTIATDDCYRYIRFPLTARENGESSCIRWLVCRFTSANYDRPLLRHARCTFESESGSGYPVFDALSASCRQARYSRREFVVSKSQNRKIAKSQNFPSIDETWTSKSIKIADKDQIYRNARSCAHVVRARKSALIRRCTCWRSLSP